MLGPKRAGRAGTGERLGESTREARRRRPPPAAAATAAATRAFLIVFLFFRPLLCS